MRQAAHHPVQRAAQADREGDRGRPEEHGDQRDRGAGRAGERGRQPDRHRPGQPQPPEQPVRGIAAARPGGPARGDGRHRAEPGRPQGRQQGRDRDQAEHGHGHGHVHPHRHAELAHAVGVRGLAQQHHGQQVAGHQAAQHAGQGGHHDLGRVGRDHLPGGEADALEDPDPAVTRHHRAADHVGHDQHRHHQADNPEGDQERHERPDLRRLLLPDGQVGLDGGYRARRQRLADRGGIRADGRGGAGTRGSGTASARCRASPGCAAG